MGIVNHYINKYMDKIKSKYGLHVYFIIHLDGRCEIKSEVDDKLVFKCNTFDELLDNLNSKEK